MLLSLLVQKLMISGIVKYQDPAYSDNYDGKIPENLRP